MSLVIGHRGASHDFPENTCAAFRGAVEQGANWAELDVRQTSDGVLVVHHNPGLADGRVICHIASDELPESVPTLAEALRACAPMGVNVEIKNSPGEPGFDDSGRLVEQTLEIIADAAVGLEILISCFDLDTLDEVRRRAPEAITGYLVLSADEPADAIALAVDRGHNAINPWNPMVTEALVDRCREASLAVNVWTVDDPDRIVQLAGWGVDGIITNRPGLAVSLLSA